VKHYLRTARVVIIMAGLIWITASCERSIQRHCVARVNVANARVE
jgi:hypothetical protein